MTYIISVTQTKGGATKTTTSINILGDYIKDTTLLVSRDLNISQHEAKQIVLDIIKKKSDSGEVIDPIVEYQGKDQNGDRVLKKRKLTKYFDGAKSGILVPSGTVYVGHDVELSIHAENTENRVKLRSACKKEGFLAEQLGDMQTAGLKEKFQKAYKLGNNAITGLFDNAYNIHYCPSSHFTLTSVTASVTSIGNSIGESMTAGNRLYTKPEIVINHIISFTTNNDFDKIKSVVSKYNLYIPSVDDCMYLILKSTRFYWKSTEKDKEIRETLELLKPEERCAFVYVNDLYHFREFNPVLVRDLFSMLMNIDDNVDTICTIMNEKLLENDVINIGSDKLMTILELANLVVSLTNSASKIIHIPALKDGDMTRRQPDNTKMKEILARDLITVEEGIKRMLANEKYLKSIGL